MAYIEFFRCSGTNEDFIENCRLLGIDLDKRVGKAQGKYRFTPSTLLNTPSAPR